MTKAGKVGLDINNDKMEYTMVIHQGRRYQQRQFVNVESHIFKRVSYTF